MSDALFASGSTGAVVIVTEHSCFGAICWSFSAASHSTAVLGDTLLTSGGDVQ